MVLNCLDCLVKTILFCHFRKLKKKHTKDNTKKTFPLLKTESSCIQAASSGAVHTLIQLLCNLRPDDDCVQTLLLTLAHVLESAR